jgi:hypothetical protein
MDVRNRTRSELAEVIVQRAIGGLVLVLVASLGLLDPAEGSLIVNGDFSVSVPSNGTGGGWTSANIDFNGGWRAGSGNPGGAFILNSGGQLATDPTISQLVTGLTPGATYRLTGQYANVYSGNSFFGNEGPNSFAIDIDGVNLDKLDYPGMVFAFGNFSFDIVAPDTDLLIAFRAEIDGDDTDYEIDNIALVLAPSAAVPEPSTLVLMLSGLLALAAQRSRRR